MYVPTYTATTANISNCLRLFVVVYKPVRFVVSCSHCHDHTYQLSWPLLLTLGTFINLLPEAICCGLQTCYFDGVLLTLPCTYTPTFMATTANIRQL